MVRAVREDVRAIIILRGMMPNKSPQGTEEPSGPFFGGSYLKRAISLKILLGLS